MTRLELGFLRLARDRYGTVELERQARKLGYDIHYYEIAKIIDGQVKEPRKENQVALRALIERLADWLLP